MKKYLVAIAVACTALFGASVQAAPVSSQASVIQSEVAKADAVVKVQHWRWGSGGWHNRSRSHWRWGSRGRGWRPGWGPRPNWGHNRRRSHWRWGSRW
ncbi:hypothetical protein KKP04_06140 [Rhodomicrobium sp. Az07]|uniref:hypothetical protein n=1 Tax=Rhodomicrobium sp. Az07 TaxID=2839034 RepID=UPI001BE65D44|nr:hypothetical protein [Rhodomicrobium sp. Az07]MBT3070443.1 hypothetical protein [Rhodomicrobium sp. Az07]